MKKALFIPIFILMLSGCISFRNDYVSSYDYNSSFINKKISITILSECYTRGGKPTHCSSYKEDFLKVIEKNIGLKQEYADYDIELEKEDLIEYLRKKNTYANVGVNEFYADYDIIINFIHDKNYSLFLSTLTFIPSFGLIPTYDNDKYVVTIDVIKKNTSDHKKNIFSTQLITIKEILLLPIMPFINPLESSLKLREDMLDRISRTIYNSIYELEKNDYSKKE